MGFADWRDEVLTMTEAPGRTYFGCRSDDDLTGGILEPRREKPQRRHGLLQHLGDYEQGSDMEPCAESDSSPRRHLLHSGTGGVGLRLIGDPR